MPVFGGKAAALRDRQGFHRFGDGGFTVVKIGEALALRWPDVDVQVAVSDMAEDVGAASPGKSRAISASMAATVAGMAPIGTAMSCLSAPPAASSPSGTASRSRISSVRSRSDWATMTSPGGGRFRAGG